MSEGRDESEAGAGQGTKGLTGSGRALDFIKSKGGSHWSMQRTKDLDFGFKRFTPAFWRVGEERTVRRPGHVCT